MNPRLKVPNPKLQAPEKFQIPSSKNPTCQGETCRLPVGDTAGCQPALQSCGRLGMAPRSFSTGEVMELELKSEIRILEIRKKSEIRRPNGVQLGLEPRTVAPTPRANRSDFELRISFGPRISAFGFQFKSPAGVRYGFSQCPRACRLCGLYIVPRSTRRSPPTPCSRSCRVPTSGPF